MSDYLFQRNLVAIYLRLSREDIDSGENESESIQNQKSMLMEYSKKNNWIIYEIYCDEDYSGAYSGTENTRPGFNKMIADAEAGKFNVVLCKSQSRFSRNMEVIEKYIHGKFSEWGIRFVGLIDNADTEVKGNKKARQINSLINEWYLEDLSENIKAVFTDKMKRGEYLASFPPYGYSKDVNNKNHLVINSQTAWVVKQIYSWHCEGYGAAKICRMLNDMQIPNPRKQQEIDGLRKTYFYAPDEKGIWSTTTVGDILNNRVYCGDVVQHTREKVSYKSKVVRKISEDERIIIKNMHEPIISREEFFETQKRLFQRRKATGTGKVHMLSGKVFCYCCGKPMQKNHTETKNGRIDYLRCRDKYAYSSKDRCDTPNIRIDIILNALQMNLIEKFKTQAVEEIDEDKILAVIKDEDNNKSLKKNRLNELNREKENIERSLEHLYSDRLNEVISLEKYLKYNSLYTSKLREIEDKIRLTDKELSNKNDNQKTDIKKAVKEFFEKRSIDRKIIESLVKRIEFGEKNPETNKPILKIFWAWE